MSRARRLSEIAKANQPVFSSTNGTQWWLADPSPKNDPDPAPPSDVPEPQPATARQVAVALQESKPESSAVQASTPAAILSPQPETQTASDLFSAPELQAASNPFPLPEPQTSAALFPAPGLQTPVNFQPEPELQKPSNGHFSAASEPVARDLASRLSSLKERFLSLGRKKRGGILE
jgi:hypothetical protein